MRVHESGNIPHIFRLRQRHVAIRALRRFRRIIERPRTLSRNAAGLPIVVLVEAANPAVMIHRHIQMHLVATRTELRRLITHEWLQENSAVRLRIQLDEKIVQRSRDWIFRCCQFVQFWIFEVKITLAHRALHLGNRVTHHAAESRLRLRAMHDLLDRCVHQSAVEHCRIVAAAAPFGRLGADGVLHVLNAFAIPLIAKRSTALAAPMPSQPRFPAQSANNIPTPASDSRMWTYSQFHSTRGVPVLIRTIPITAPAASSTHPARAAKLPFRSKRKKKIASMTAATTPVVACSSTITA